MSLLATTIATVPITAAAFAQKVHAMTPITLTTPNDLWPVIPRGDSATSGAASRPNKLTIDDFSPEVWRI